MSLLAAHEPPAFLVENEHGASPILITCDHASPRVPAALGTLGLDEAQRVAHIAWDPGALDAARALSRRFDAPLVASVYSRLAIDCNRPLDAASSIPTATCGVRVPGNEALPEADRRARQDAFFWPYHRAIERVLAAREARGLATIVVAMHSFTPEPLYGPRPWHIGLLYGGDARLAHAMFPPLRAVPGLVVGDNEPYRVTPGSDYGIPVYAERAGRPGVLVELRQDLATDPDRSLWLVDAVARALEEAIVALR
jgi:predicted N-formylglutamate amidohydrolase